MKRKISLFSLVIMLLISVSATIFTASASSDSIVIDPGFNIIAGGSEDMAIIKDDGTIDLNITPTPGFGFRANMSALGEKAMFDVKDFTTTFTLRDVPVNVSTIFALQTFPTGTIGGGNGNAINFMFRRDAEDIVAVAIYNAAASEPAIWAPGHLALGEDYSVTITFDYDSETPITIGLKESYSLPGTDLGLYNQIDTHYAESNYKGYYSLSSYFFSAPSTIKADYTIKSINGKAPLESYKTVVNSSIAAFESAVTALNENSTIEQIEQAGALDVFTVGSPLANMLSVIDEDNALVGKVDAARVSYKAFYEIVMFENVKGQIEAFKQVLNTANLNNENGIEQVITVYEAIDRQAISELSDEYKTQLTASLDELTKGDNFKKVISSKTNTYISTYENKLANGEVASLQSYNDLVAIVDNWSNYKELNYIDAVLSVESIEALNNRVEAISKQIEKSIYSNFWTEGTSWEAIKTDKGLYATGAGTYNETLGFNQKLEVGKDAKIKFNVIYALRVLGANHLHIGFYPQTGTGTRGEVEGVRVDFWFSQAGAVEIKAVSGKTETEIFTPPYLSLVDSGLFDLDAEVADYAAGQYEIELTKTSTGSLVVLANGQELDISGIDASLFDNGCYLTVSAMSVAGAENNEVLITQVGEVSFIGEYKGNDEPTDVIVEAKNNTALIIVLSIVAAAIVAAAVVVVIRKNKIKK